MTSNTLPVHDPVIDTRTSRNVRGLAESPFVAFTTPVPRPPSQEFPMKMKTALLIVNPCDDEEDNMAMLCCHSDQGDMFLMSRYPDEDELEITLDGEPSTLEGVKVTLSPALLKIEIAAADADALNGDDVLEITFDADMTDLAEVEETLQNILKGTGTYISQL
jgi:hypothetical protein